MPTETMIRPKVNNLCEEYSLLISQENLIMKGKVMKKYKMMSYEIKKKKSDSCLDRLNTLKKYRIN